VQTGWTLLVELIRAVAAASLVALLPGWFWAGCLCATPDRADRLTYSVALSIALVPAAALVPMRLLDTGVTLAVASSTALVVFFGGLVAYLRFGPAKGTYEPLFSGSSTLGMPVLVILVSAFGLVLWSGLQMVPGRLNALAALLVIAAGVVHLVVSLRKPAPQEPSLEEALPETYSPLTRRLLLPAVLLLVLGRAYSGPVLHDWPFVRGVDHYSHAVMANLRMTRGEIEPYLIYPPGFHTLTAMISRLGRLDPLEIFPVLGPALLLLPALACYTLARGLWGWPYGVAAALFAGVLNGGTYYYFNDAMYPNLVTSQFLLVVVIAALTGFYNAPSPRRGLALALVGSSVVLYHPVASLYEAALLVLVSVYFLPYLLARAREGARDALFTRAPGLSLVSTPGIPTTSRRRSPASWARRRRAPRIPPWAWRWGRRSLTHSTCWSGQWSRDRLRGSVSRNASGVTWGFRLSSWWPSAS
jgi:hypothetical protein